MIIDTHVHVWALDSAPGHQPDPEALIPAPTEAAPVEWLIQDMHDFGIDHCVLVQSSAFGTDNRYLLECLNRYPGKFKAMGIIDPVGSRNVGEEEIWLQRGLSGFRFHPLYYADYQWLDSPASDAVWHCADEYGAVLQFHIRPEHAPALARMAGRHRSVKVVVDHLGKPDVLAAEPYRAYESVLRLADLPNTWMKIGDYQIASRGTYPWRDTWPFVEWIRDSFGARRMIWGTGYPGRHRPVPLDQALTYLEELPLSADERHAILWDTPARLFGFPEPPG